MLQLRCHHLGRAETGPERLFGQYGDEPAATAAQHLLPREPGRRGGFGVIGQAEEPHPIADDLRSTYASAAFTGPRPGPNSPRSTSRCARLSTARSRPCAGWPASISPTTPAAPTCSPCPAPAPTPLSRAP